MLPSKPSYEISPKACACDMWPELPLDFSCKLTEQPLLPTSSQDGSESFEIDPWSAGLLTGQQVHGLQNYGMQGSGQDSNGLQGSGRQGSATQGSGGQGSSMQGSGRQGSGTQSYGLQGSCTQGYGLQGSSYGLQGSGYGRQGSGYGLQGSGLQGSDRNFNPSYWDQCPRLSHPSEQAGLGQSETPELDQYLYNEIIHPSVQAHHCDKPGLIPLPSHSIKLREALLQVMGLKDLHFQGNASRRPPSGPSLELPATQCANKQGSGAFNHMEVAQFLMAGEWVCARGGLFQTCSSFNSVCVCVCLSPHTGWQELELLQAGQDE